MSVFGAVSLVKANNLAVGSVPVEVCARSFSLVGNQWKANDPQFTAVVAHHGTSGGQQQLGRHMLVDAVEFHLACRLARSHVPHDQ